jgi:arylsulfatase A-like enzyme
MKAFFDKKVQKAKADDGDDENPTSRKGPSFENLDVPDHAYTDGVDALLAKQQLIKFSKNTQPYFMAVGFHKPHLPFVAPKKYWDLYKYADMPLATFQEHSKNGVEMAYHRSGELRNYTDIPAFATYNEEGGLHVNIKEEKQRELIHGYYAAVSYMDAQVGILLNTLDSLGTLNNTVIVLWGDHGWHLGDHDLWEKHTNFEQATRAPLIIAAPGIKSGKTSSQTEHLDIFPTICDLAGTPIPTFLDGKSLKSIMVNNKAKVKDFSVSQYPRKLKKEEQKSLGYATNKLMGYAMRTEKYRYVLWMSDFTSNDPYSAKKVYASELYDYEKDPLEKVNVVKDKKYATIAKDMNAKMLAFFKSNQK